MSSPTPTPAPERPLPPSNLYSVEFPGYVTSTPSAITHLGGQKSLERAFRRNATKLDSMLELSWRPGDPFAHRVPGDGVCTSGIVVRVVKRRRKRKERIGEGNGEGEAGPSNVKDDALEGEFTIEPVGVVNRTVRFRSE
jgi:general transcription factor 3C polypeptide 5 (transcription factor C subunit 1)